MPLAFDSDNSDFLLTLLEDLSSDSREVSFMIAVFPDEDDICVYLISVVENDFMGNSVFGVPFDAHVASFCHFRHLFNA
ncbi:hypothetical protein HFX_6430 (plasmid) [Haloferax mediterranei ATCC 33500]|uniref:Uncharacterized protein n=1 Tax=Haloferax mediterranei (strain ATCC 33500 / DSM 1411 / JCM 8866 / NBRC 14739 / NCIMB 2177 / R-4) TaxID=523841 RepID=I3RBD9_HALMT|nr:hypothetical protein HFX_6430 [Haloferax mediterranei ATCC 33500]